MPRRDQVESTSTLTTDCGPSGGLFAPLLALEHHRMALSACASTPLWPAGRISAGLGRTGRCTDRGQNSPHPLADPARGQVGLLLLPRQWLIGPRFTRQ